jgi:tetratricopeptide (TPR) repeat protein
LKHIALLLLCVGEFDKAIEIYESNLLTEPVNLFSRGFLMAGYELAGNREQARQEYDIGEELSPVWWGDTVNVFLALGRNEPPQGIDELVGVSADLKHLLRNLQDSTLVESGLAAYQARENKFSAEALYYSAIAAYSGDNELAVELMRVALADVWTSLFWLWLPVYDEVRELESFRTLLKDSGIVEFWQQKGWPEVCQPSGDSFVCDWKAYP